MRYCYYVSVIMLVTLDWFPSGNTYSHQKLNRFLSNTSQLVHLSISPDTEFDRVVSHEKFDWKSNRYEINFRHICDIFIKTLISVMDFLYSCNYPKLVNKVTVFFSALQNKKKKWFLIICFFSFNIFHLSKIITKTRQCDQILSVYQTWTIPSRKGAIFMITDYSVCCKFTQ